MDLKEIRSVIDLMSKNKLAEFELEKDNFKIKIKKSGEAVPQVSYAPAPAAPAAAPAPTAVTPAPAAATAADDSGASINSPMVGTFYRAPSPDSPPFVDVGSKVTPDTVVCIVEAMKVMNEIKAETTGVITEILVESGKPAEFSQPLFKIKAS
ncbi:MAG: acetyl-CoA carboxylase biotin carboxyl carrier protein [Verrucomicrobiota bacterium]